MSLGKLDIRNNGFVPWTLCAVFLYAVCAGFRDNYGLLLPYVVERTSIPYERVSFVIALGQLFFGLMQPVFGYVALRSSNRLVMLAGSLMMLAGLLLVPVSTTLPLLAASLGFLLPSGTAAFSFGVVMSCLLRRFDAGQARYASGMVSSGIGLSILVLYPTLQSVAGVRGLEGAVGLLCVPVALLVPVSLLLTRGDRRAPGPSRAAASAPAMFLEALRSSPYRRVVFAFFTCGFHMALIQTHLFSQLAASGLSARASSHALAVYGAGAVAGAVGSGILLARFPAARVLAALYSARCLLVLPLLVPVSGAALHIDVLLLGMTGIATIAPTSAFVGGLFGAERLAALFGLAYLLHQIGAFASAWAGGICLELTGGYGTVWIVDVALCLCAGLACLSVGPASGRRP